MSNPVSSIPPGNHTLTAHLTVHGAAAAIDFYKRAFGAVELRREMMPKLDLVMFAELQIGDSRLFLNDEFPPMEGMPDMGIVSPQTLKGTAVTIHMFVPDVNAAFQRAVDAGARVAMPPADQFWGDRLGILADPFGHRWSLATPIAKSPPGT